MFLGTWTNSSEKKKKKKKKIPLLGSGILNKG